MTTYIALSQTVTAFMHEYLIRTKSAVATFSPVAAGTHQTPAGFGGLDDSSLRVLFVMGSAAWVLTTYVGPLTAILSSPVRVRRRWVFVAYYFALQVPMYWVYAKDWHLDHAQPEQPVSMTSLFVFQFIQPLLWLY